MQAKTSIGATQDSRKKVTLHCTKSQR